MPIIVKNTTFPSLLDLVAPHSCRGCGHIGSVLCDCCKNYIISHHTNLCPNCKRSNPTGNCTHCPDLSPIYVLGDKDSLLGTLVRDYKYNSVRALGSTFASLLDATLPTLPRSTIIVPLPTASHHIRARGLDHTYLIAKHLARSRRYTVQRLLLRARNTVQVGADKSTRLAQASHAYTINPSMPIDPSATYLLLDDIWTTGASIRAALSKIQQAGATNIAVALLAVSKLH